MRCLRHRLVGPSEAVGPFGTLRSSCYSSAVASAIDHECGVRLLLQSPGSGVIPRGYRALRGSTIAATVFGVASGCVALNGLKQRWLRHGRSCCACGALRQQAQHISESKMHQVSFICFFRFTFCYGASIVTLFARVSL